MDQPEKTIEKSEESKKHATIRVLALVNDENLLNAAFQFLRSENFELRVAHTVTEFLNVLFDIKPNLALVSWNLKNANPKKTYSIITEKFKLPCVMIPEEASAKTSAAMLSSGLPNIVLAPLTGRKIQLRFEGLLRKKAPAKTFSPDQSTAIAQLSESPDLQSLEEIPAHELPIDTIWKPDNSELKVGSESDVKIWKGVSEKNSKTYFFKGPLAPKLMKATQSWTTEGSGSIMISPRDTENEMAIKQTSEEIDWEALKKETLGERASFENFLREEASVPSPIKNIFFEAVNATLKLNFELVEPHLELEFVSHFYSLQVHTQSFNGLLLFMSRSPGFINPEKSRDFLKNLTETLSLIDPTFKIQPLQNFELQDIQLQAVQRQCDFLFYITDHSEKALVGCLSTENFPQLMGNSEGYVAIDLALHVFTNSTLNFDLYIYLEKNHRYLHYLKKGSFLSAHVYSKLLSAHTLNVYIKAEAAPLFELYTATHRTRLKLA